jgi:membrane protein
MSSATDFHAPPAQHPPHPPFDLASSLKRTFEIVKEAGSRWVDDACYRMGASLAYYAIFSLFPLLLIAVTFLGFLLGDDPSTRAKVLASVSTFLSPQFQSLLDDTLKSMQSHETARGVGAVIGVLMLLFGASGVFSELETSLNTIWRVKAAPSTSFRETVLSALKDKAISFVAVIGAGAVLLSSLVVSTALSAFSGAAEHVIPNALLWSSVNVALTLCIATLLFATLFRLLPQAKVAWRDVFGGALFTAVFFSVLKHILAWYLGHLGSYAAYGAVGAMLGLLTWIYLASLLVFFGAELTRVYAEREGSVASVAKKGPRESREARA